MPSVQIRCARSTDRSAYAALFPELGIDDPIPDVRDFENRILPHTLVAERSGAVVGFVWYVQNQASGYIRQLVVDPAFRRQGLGRRLMLEAAVRLQKNGAGSWYLNVKPANKPALALYEQLGFSPRHLSVALRIRWSEVHAMQDPSDRSYAVPLLLDRAAHVEKSLGLATGKLDRILHDKNLVIMELQSASGAILGVAAFDPGFPGASPFCVRDVQWTKPLLAALEPFGRRETPYLQIVDKADSELSRYLRSHGAEVRLEILCLEGTLDRALLAHHEI